VLERALVPTAAYVAGPGEMAYFAQVSAVASALELPQPLVVPRWSATIIEPRVQRILDEFDLAGDAFSDPHAVETRVARARAPHGATQALEALRRDVASGIDLLGASAEDLLSDTVIDGLRRNLGHRLDRVERRLVAAVKRREVEAMHRIATARGSLYPHGVKQERKLAYMPLLARYGESLLEQMLGEARAHARTIVGASASESTRSSGASAAAASPARSANPSSASL
jgi:bacillithiol synthase